VEPNAAVSPGVTVLFSVSHIRTPDDRMGYSDGDCDRRVRRTRRSASADWSGRPVGEADEWAGTPPATNPPGASHACRTVDGDRVKIEV
jgi:hypothetical protein